MADTQRTRTQVLAIFADNVTGQISEQDLRDFAVTIMESEFANPGDFWARPDARYTNTDKTARGWKINSQYIGEACSWMNIMYMNPNTGHWSKADADDSTENGLLGVAMDSYSLNESQASILLEGLIYDSSFSATFISKIGQPVYLESGIPGSISAGIPDNSARVIGVVMPSTVLSITSAHSDGGKWYFKPDSWGVSG